MIGLASALPFSLLAQYRARVLHESVLPRSAAEVVLAAGFVVTGLFCAAALQTPASGVGVAMLGVMAWTDMRLRRVYMPVTAAAAAELALLGLFHRLPADALVGVLALGTISLTLWVVAARRGGWAGGDVLLFALTGAAFGFQAGIMLIAVAFVGGAVVYGVLIALRIMRADATIPMILLLYAALPLSLALAQLFPRSFIL